MSGMVMTGKAKEIEDIMIGLGDEAQAAHLMRFFKCAPGEYGYGDRFLGIRVPATRSLVKECRSLIEMEDAEMLVTSQWHEVRLAGFMFLIELYKKAVKAHDEIAAEKIVNAYIDLIPYGRNWDLVDVIAPKILGDYLVGHPDRRSVLYDFADRTDSLWHQRVAIVCTWKLICEGYYEDTIRLARKYLDHPHDLIHKATGWMLREVGKRGGEEELRRFLDRHASSMPRTMLRYSIERFPESDRRHYLKL